MISDTSILDALRTVKDPDFDKDIVTLKQVKELRIDGGRVSFTVEQVIFGSPWRQQVGEQAGAAAKRVAGVSAVDVTMTAKVRAAVISDMSKQPVPGVRNIVAVGAGKGGGGKTTVSVNLAIALSQAGARGARFEADSSGPTEPMIMGTTTPPAADGSRILPADQYGIQ